MTDTNNEKLMQAKAFCYDYGMKLEQIERAWQNALDQGHKLAHQLKRSGCTWLDLNPTVWRQLVDRYSGSEETA